MADQRSCIGKFYSKSTLQGMAKAELIELLDIAQHNYSVLKESYDMIQNFLLENEDEYEVVEKGNQYKLRLKRKRMKEKIFKLLLAEEENIVLEKALDAYLDHNNDGTMNEFEEEIRMLIVHHLLHNQSYIMN